MAKKYSIKFWITFWTVSAILLTGWYLFLETKKVGIGNAVSNAVNFLPFNEQQKKEFGAVATLADYFMKEDGVERTFLVLFQNNMEIRPGGGFIGAFGIVKMKDGKITLSQTHDLSNFDARIPDTVTPPYPMKETLGIKSWKLRDSNFSPDFAVNAKKAEEFYYMGDGQERFDGVIGVTTNVLSSMLEITGPVTVEGYPGTYDSENAVIALEYQVEKAFEDQGIDRGERKSIMADLARVIQERIFALSSSEKIKLAEITLQDLNKKDIQLYFNDEYLQNIVQKSGWAGQVDSQWSNDYLMTVDANLGAFKSDYYVNRSIEYNADYSKEIPTANLKITYNHTARQKDWMTRDYLTYLRVYVPEGSWLKDSKNFDGAKFANEFGKKSFSSIVKVPINSSKTVEINYTLPRNIKNSEYDFKIQKQAGLNDVPIAVHVINADGSRNDFSTLLNQDLVMSDFLNK